MKSLKDQVTFTQVSTRTKMEINQNYSENVWMSSLYINYSVQLGQIHRKWMKRSKVGIYLGPSPIHNKNFTLVLYMTNRLVSHRFHELFDSEFRTEEDDITAPMWKIKAS